MRVPDNQAAVEPKFTCRVWVKAAAAVLNDKRIINCTGVDALEKEFQTLLDQ